MKPEKVKPKKFTVKSIIYDDGDFSIAYGIWKNQEKRIGLRWNGTKEDKGYPKQGENPLWFILSEKFTIDILKSTIDKKDSNLKDIIKILESLLS